MMDNERRHFLEAKRAKAEALVKKVGDARGLTRSDVLKRIITKPKPYVVRGSR